MENLPVEESNPAQFKLIPDGYHCAVTWGIPFDFGGMTEAMLHRSRAFVREAEQSVDVLTFAYANDYADIECELFAEGKLIPGMRLRNFWDEMARISDAIFSDAVQIKKVKGKFEPIGEQDQFTEDRFDGVTRRRLRIDESHEATLQVDYLRPDGSVFVSDRRDLDTKGTVGGRIVTLCDSRGEAIASWNQIWPLYLLWLDVVAADRETFMIVDSKSTANFISRYRRPNVVTMHLVHNSHMASGAVPPHGELSPTRRYVFERLSSFDSVVFLTQQQKEDVDTLLGPQENTSVIPNSRSLPEEYFVETPHEIGSGVVLASLTKRKRLGHAIRAVVQASDGADTTFTLQIHGHGPEAASLTKLVHESNLEGQVQLMGYHADAKEHFKFASFTLLTSTLEGQGLVLIEAMSVGCIPISYDIPYGPSDFIEDGVNGFLVKPGDVSGMAKAIVHLSQLDASAVVSMRRSARQTAERFSDSSVTVDWGQTMRAAVDRKLELSLPAQPHNTTR